MSGQLLPGDGVLPPGFQLHLRCLSPCYLPNSSTPGCCTQINAAVGCLGRMPLPRQAFKPLRRTQPSSPLSSNGDLPEQGAPAGADRGRTQCCLQAAFAELAPYLRWTDPLLFPCPAELHAYPVSLDPHAQAHPGRKLLPALLAAPVQGECPLHECLLPHGGKPCPHITYCMPCFSR